MMTRPPKTGAWLIWLVLVPAAALLALLVGAANAVLPRILVIGLAALFVLGPLYLFKPSWLIVPVILFQMYSPSQPVADVVTVLLLVRGIPPLVARWRLLAPALSSGLLKPLYVLGLCVLVSFGVAITVLQHGKSPVYQDGRIFVYWLWLIPFVAWAPLERPQRWLASILLTIGAVVAVLAVVQGAFGISLVPTGRVGQLETLGQYASGITRVQIPGFIFVTFGLFYCAAQIVKRGANAKQALHLVLLALFALAIIYNFGRAIWFWSVLGVVITALLMGLRASLKMVFWGTVVFTVFAVAIMTVKPRLADTMVDRVISLAGEGGVRTSYGWREVENDSARQTLGSSMMLGTGLGGKYRAPVLGLRAFENHTWYIHNGHLSVMLKLSVLGYAAYLALFFMMLRRSLMLRTSATQAPLACATIAWVLTFLGQNLTQPDIMTAHGLTLIAALVANLVLHEMTSRRDRTAATGAPVAAGTGPALLPIQPAGARR